MTPSVPRPPPAPAELRRSYPTSLSRAAWWEALVYCGVPCDFDLCKAPIGTACAAPDYARTALEPAPSHTVRVEKAWAIVNGAPSRS